MNPHPPPPTLPPPPSVVTALGLDFSTQSVKALVSVFDVASGEHSCPAEKSVNFVHDPRLGSKYPLSPDDYMCTEKSEPGEANQQALLPVAALDAVLTDLSGTYDLGRVDVINVSAQQHAHVFLSRDADAVLDRLNAPTDPALPLDQVLRDLFALPFMRTWRTSCTAKDASVVRERVRGKRRMIEITGSDAPPRFSGFGLRRTALRFPEEYSAASRFHQLSSLIPAVLTGRADVPLDYGNACGTSLMDYAAKDWSQPVLEAVAADLPGGVAALRSKLPRIVSAKTVVGNVSQYFVSKYGFSEKCCVCVGSGDNPQTKALVGGTLLSLGSSFVLMAATATATTGAEGVYDWSGSANAMYDALDRPFAFGCRTNGALMWNKVREMHGIAPNDHQAFEAALRAGAERGAPRPFLWNEAPESFPVGPQCGPLRDGFGAESAADISGIVDSSLGSVRLHSASFTSAEAGGVLLAGGPSASAGVCLRVSAIWDEVVHVVRSEGAALGAALSGAVALLEKMHCDSVLCNEFVNKAEKTFYEQGSGIRASETLVSTYKDFLRELDRFEKLNKIVDL